MVNWQPLIKNMPHIIGLVVLIFILLFLLVNFGYIGPCDVPGFKDVYYGIKGYPTIGMVSDDWDMEMLDSVAGMGNPDLLRTTITRRTHMFPTKIWLENLKTGGILDKYQIVIVERAKNIDTATLSAFRDYVQKGGRLVWIGDAGTGLGENDYVCEEITFAFLPAAEVSVGDNQTITQCSSEWVFRTPNVPEEVEGGLCGKTVSDIVLAFVRENESLYNQVTQGDVFLCPDEDITTEPYQVRGGERILWCLERIRALGLEVDEESISEHCAYGVNYWNRGNTITETGKTVDKFNFGSIVLGLDYISQSPGTGLNLFLQPVDPMHSLIKGFSTRMEITEWFGASAFSITDTTGYEMRTSSIMNLKYGNDVYPAIVVSSPVGPLLTKRGLIVYYAFPPEVGVESGRGVNLIDNLIQFSICS